MQLLQHFKELTVQPKNAQELKGLILQLAIQGKLTANWREENSDIEPASELLKRIQKEKEQLIKDKKIKKDKLLPTITKDEEPYNLPKGWVWCKLDDVIILIMGQSPPSSSYNDKGNGEILINGPVEFSKSNYGQTKTTKYTNKPTKMCKKGDLIVCIRASIGKTNIASNNACIGRGVAALQPQIEFKYTHNFILANVSNIYDLGTGTTFRSVSKDIFRSMLFPLPPLEEQKEIVKVVKTLFKEVEQLEQLTLERMALKEDFATSALHQLTTNTAKENWTYLQAHFKNFFNETGNIKKLRETVLQLAVQGKLTADWRTCHPELAEGSHHASELLKRIQEEKAQLIKDKKIKKEKALPKINKEEIPYKLPEGWVWCRMGDVTILITDGKHGNCQDEINSGYYFLSAKDVQKGKLLYEYARQINFKEFSEVHQRTNLESGDLCIVNTGATVGKSAIVKDNEYTRKTTFQKSVAVVKVLHEYIDINYLDNFIKNRTPQLLKKSGGSAINNLLLGDMKKIVTPLPPLEEQKAIVEKVNALMELCDGLEQEVQHSQEQSELLMKSCLREVFEGRGIN
jgi:type I restriction enzyme S subunit